VGVEARDDAFEARDRGVLREHKRVVAGDDVIRRGGEFLNRLEAFDHLRDVDDDGIGSHRFHVFVLVRGVGGEEDKAAPGADAHDLYAERMTSDVMERDAGGEFGIAIVKLDAAFKDAVDHRILVALMEFVQRIPSTSPNLQLGHSLSSRNALVALQKLELALESAKAHGDNLVIDHVERQSEN
jgi:hypothetical protein